MRLRDSYREPVSLFNIKLTDKDRRLLERKARKYQNGNRSQLVRLAIKHFSPVVIRQIR